MRVCVTRVTFFSPISVVLFHLVLFHSQVDGKLNSSSEKSRAGLGSSALAMY